MSDKAQTTLQDHQHAIDLETYILEHIDQEPEVLRQLRRLAHLRLVNPRMLSGHLQGRLLRMLVRMVRPRCILEIGTYTAYATVCMAEGLGEGGRIDTIEVNDELQPFITEALSLTGVSSIVTLHIGDACEIIPTLPIEEMDFVFMDANKRHYMDYLRLIQDRLPIGAFIIADNTLWDGKVIDDESRDQQTEGIRLFNDFIARSARFEKVILPIRDGLTLIHKIN